MIKVGKISDKCGILTVEEKRIAIIVNKGENPSNVSKANIVRRKTVEGIQDAY